MDSPTTMRNRRDQTTPVRKTIPMRLGRDTKSYESNDNPSRSRSKWATSPKLILLTLALTASIYLYRQYFANENINIPFTYKKTNHARVQPQDQRVVFFAGPHKTGSTSIQQNILTWSETGNLGNWKWAAPNDSEGPFALVEGGKGKKVFAPMLNILGNRTRVFRNVPKGAGQIQEMMDIYRETFRNAWEEGYNVVFGGEGGDYVLNESHISSTEYIKRILGMMPWSDNSRYYSSSEKLDNKSDESIQQQTPLHGSDANFTVAITYRAPRVDHFVSAWHMFGFPPKMRNWTIHLDYDMHLLDPLGMAEAYANYGLNVVILDLSGTRRDGIDLSSAAVCDILSRPCDNWKVLGKPHERQMGKKKEEEHLQPVMLNKMKEGRIVLERKFRDFTNEELERIDSVFRKFDCHNYRHLVSNPNIRILHGYSLLKTMIECPNDAPPMSRPELLEEIKKIAREGESFVKTRKDNSVDPPVFYHVDIRKEEGNKNGDIPNHKEKDLHDVDDDDNGDDGDNGNDDDNGDDDEDDSQ